MVDERERSSACEPSSATQDEAATVVSGEHQRVAILSEIFAKNEGDSSSDNVVLGIGDDAALLRAQSGTLVWSIDEQVEERHFRRAWMSLSDIGFRATMAALSDLAAMGARPLGVLSALALPFDLTDGELRELAGGQREAASSVGTRVLGGNLTRAEALSISTTVLGVSEHPVLRSGARVGDTVWLAGYLGRSACGLASLLRAEPTSRVPACDVALTAFRRPLALIDAGRAASAARASAMIDVSDGLAADLGRLARDSHVAIVLDGPSLEDAVVNEVATSLGMDRREPTLHGGEDYALVATAPLHASMAGFRAIGVVRDDLAPGIFLDEAGALVRVVERGFDHFAPRSP